jgi:hypothetical protein
MEAETGFIENTILFIFDTYSERSNPSYIFPVSANTTSALAHIRFSQVTRYVNITFRTEKSFGSLIHILDLLSRYRRIFLADAVRERSQTK